LRSVPSRSKIIARITGAPRAWRPTGPAGSRQRLHQGRKPGEGVRTSPSPTGRIAPRGNIDPSGGGEPRDAPRFQGPARRRRRNRLLDGVHVQEADGIDSHSFNRNLIHPPLLVG
jgi:hypothetical protein